MTNPQKPGKPDPPGLKLRLGDDPPEKTRITNDPSAPVSPEVQNFLVALAKSKLLDDQQLTEVRKFARTVGNVAAITGDLTARQWLTPWQAQRLIAGETGFFLGKYCLLKKLGEGGMGAVYEARQGVTDRIVAVKVMAPAIAEDPVLVARFEREVQAAVALNHPNIVSAFDADSSGKHHFLVMEHVAGQDLGEWITAHRTLPVGWSCECIRQACLGLEHAHQRGLVHRDLKPSNLLVIGRSFDEPPAIKILDMGLARFKVEGEAKDLTHTGQLLGTPQFISPEQAKNTKSADIRSDIYSLGCTLFKMLTGKNVFEGNTVTEQLAARFEGPARSLSELAPDMPMDVIEIVDKALERKPEKRFQTPLEMARAIESFLATQPGWSSSSLEGKTAVDLKSDPTWAEKGKAKSTVFPSDSPTLAAARAAGAKGSKPPVLWLGLGTAAAFGLGAAVVFALGIVFAMQILKKPEEPLTQGPETPAKSIDTKTPVTKSEDPPTKLPETKLPETKLPETKTQANDPPTKTVTVPKTAGPAPFGNLLKQIHAVRRRPAYGVALSPDGKLVACASASEQLVLYDYATGDEVARLEGHKGAVSSVVFSKDGQTLYSAGEDKIIRIWEVASRQPKGTLEGHTGPVNKLMFLRDDVTLASCSHDKTVRLWKDGQQVQSLADGDRLMCLDISTDGKLLAAIGLEGDLSVWSLETYEKKFRLKAHAQGHGVAFSPDGSLIATSSSREKAAAVWDTKTEQLVFRLPPQADAVSTLLFAPDGLLYVGSNVVRAWNVKDKTPLDPALSNDDPCMVNSIALSPDKKLLLTGDVRGQVRIYAAE